MNLLYAKLQDYRCGVALAMHHRQSQLRALWPTEGAEHPACAWDGARQPLLLGTVGTLALERTS